MKFKFFLLALSGLAVITALLLALDRPLITTSAAEEASLSVARLQDTLPPPSLGAHAFISALIRTDGQVEVLTEKNAHQRWPIASITKLFTASIALEKYKLSEAVVLEEEDLPETFDSGLFRVGESFRVDDILKALLLQSSNNAAVTLSRFDNNQAQFMAEMNSLAQRLELRDTRFFNPNGLDPAGGETGTNYSSVHDLTLFAKWLIRNQPEILALTKTPNATIRQANGDFHHEAHSTNEILITEPWSSDILGGKTGFTELAGKNLLLVLRAPDNQGYLVNIVLGSPDHFLEMRKLVSWVLGAYRF